METVIIIGIIADNFDHYRWAKDHMERSPHFEKASFKPLLKEDDLRAIWSSLTWVLDYRMRYTMNAQVVEYRCRERQLVIRKPADITKEYGIKF